MKLPKINLAKILQIASVVIPLAPAIIQAGKSVVKSKGATLPDIAINAASVAGTLVEHHERLDELETILRAAQAAGILPTQQTD